MRIRILLLLLVFVLFASCSKAKVAGASSETTNGMSVAGNVVLPSDNENANVYLYSNEQLNSEVISQSTDENGRFVFENIPLKSYRLSIFDESGDLGVSKELGLKEDYNFPDLELDSLALVYLIVDNKLEGKITLVKIPDYGYTFEKDIEIDKDTILIAKVPAGVYNQIIINLDSVNDVIGSSSIPLLNSSVSIRVGEKKYFDLELLEEMSQPNGFYSVDYLDENIYDTVEVSTYADLKTHLASTTAQVIKVNGMIEGNVDLVIESNKYIVGTDDSSGIDGFGIKAEGQRELVFRNINFVEALEDGLTLSNTKRVWIDHCVFDQAQDELFSVIEASDSISVSWSRFSNDGRGVVVGYGSSDNSEYLNMLNVTFYQNKFVDITSQAPLVRFGTVHMVSNVLSNIEDYAVSARMDSKLLLEDNIFIDVNKPFWTDDPDNYDAEEYGNELIDSGELDVSGNVDQMPYEVPAKRVNWILYSVGSI